MFSNWRRAQKLPDKAPSALQPRGAERTNELEKANQDLKAGQAELQKRWQYLAEAQKLSHSGTFGWKVRTGELIWSEETYRILGFTRETNPTLDLVFDRIHPEDRERLQQLRDSAAQNGMDLDVEYGILLPDGVLRYLHVVAHAGEDRSGNREYIGIVSDITERKLAEQERQKLSRDLKESNARLEEAQRVAHVGYWEWDLETGEVIWSDETYRIFGLKPQECPMNLAMVRQMVHPEDRDALYSGVDVELDAGVHPVAEFRIVTPSGEVRTVQAITSKLWGAMRGDPDNEASGKARRLFGTVQDVTEIKRAEEAHHVLSRDLQESKARLEEAERVANLGYWIWNLDTNRVVFSNETCRIYGITPQEGSIDLAAIRELIHPEDREYVFENAERAVRDGVHIETEHRLMRPSGEIRIVYSRGDLTRDESGRPYEMFGTCQDITERKRAEEKLQVLSRDLQESKAWLEEAQRVAHIGYWVWDLETNQVIWSEETYRIFGLMPQVGSFDVARVGEMMHPEDREAVFRAAEEAIRSGTRADCEHRLVRPDGEIRVVHSLGEVKKNSQGRTQMFGTTQDITDRKRIEEERQNLSYALQESNARLEEAQRVAHIGHYEFNPVENQVTWSAELCRIWGIPPVKRPIDLEAVFEMIHPDDREYAARAVDEIIRSGRHLKYEHRIVRPDGEVRFLQVLGTVKRDASGRAYELFGTCQDITDRKLAEQTLRRNQFYLSEGERLAHMGSWASKDLGIRWTDGLDIYWSDEVYKIFGFDPKNGTPQLPQFLAAIHPQDRASLTEAMKKMHEQHCGCDVTNRIVRPDGEIRYVRCVGVPVVEDGVFQGFNGTTMDVTEHELLTQELRRQQAYLTEAQSLTHSGSWACNLVTREIFHSSDENARLYGFDPSQGPIPFDSYYSTIFPEDEPALSAKLESAISSGADYDVEFRIRRSEER